MLGFSLLFFKQILRSCHPVCRWPPLYIYDQPVNKALMKACCLDPLGPRGKADICAQLGTQGSRKINSIFVSPMALKVLMLPLLRWPGSWVGKIPRRRHGYPLRHSCLENPMDRGAWWAAVHGVTERRTRLSDRVCSPHSSWGRFTDGRCRGGVLGWLICLASTGLSAALAVCPGGRWGLCSSVSLSHDLL